jgi:hypothetical protein
LKSDESFIIRDATGQALAYVYFKDEPVQSENSFLLWTIEAATEPTNIVCIADVIILTSRRLGASSSGAM